MQLNSHKNLKAQKKKSLHINLFLFLYFYGGNLFQNLKLNQFTVSAVTIKIK